MDFIVLTPYEQQRSERILCNQQRLRELGLGPPANSNRGQTAPPNQRKYTKHKPAPAGSRRTSQRTTQLRKMSSTGPARPPLLGNGLRPPVTAAVPVTTSVPPAGQKQYQRFANSFEDYPAESLLQKCAEFAHPRDRNKIEPSVVFAILQSMGFTTFDWLDPKIQLTAEGLLTMVTTAGKELPDAGKAMREKSAFGLRVEFVDKLRWHCWAKAGVSGEPTARACSLLLLLLTKLTVCILQYFCRPRLGLGLGIVTGKGGETD